MKVLQITLDMARAIVNLLERPTRYEDGIGATCPLCGARRVPVNKTIGKVRYHRCADCQATFKSVHFKRVYV